MAGLLILGLDYDYYHRVTSIIVSPTTVVLEGTVTSVEAFSPTSPSRSSGRPVRMAPS